MEIENMEDLICNVKEGLKDTYCTITNTKAALQDYAKAVHTHAIEDITNLSTALSNKADKTPATTTTDGLMSASDKVKLDGLSSYSHPKHTAKSGQPTSDASPGFGDTFKVSQVVNNNLGHVTALNDKTITIPNTQVTTSKDGLMIASDKVKLDGIPSDANHYVHPTNYDTANSGLYKITVENTGHVSNVEEVTRNDIINLGISGGDTTYSEATESNPGLMSKDDKYKLNHIDTEANKYTHPTTYTAQNSGLYKIAVENTGHVKSAVAVDKNDIVALGIPEKNTTYSEATESNPGLMSKEDKYKLNHIATEANKYVHPTTYTAKNNGLYKVTIENTGHVSGPTDVDRNDIIALGIPGQDTTYSAVQNSGSTPGLMTVADKQKLDLQSDYQIFISPSNTATNPANLSNTINVRRGDRIYALVKKNGVIVENKKVVFIINGVIYERSQNSDDMGFAGLNINTLRDGDYFTIAMYRENGWAVAIDFKTITVKGQLPGYDPQ